MIKKVKNEVYKLLNKDKSGHGMDHINRVLDLSLKFAEKENVSKDIVSLIALLHDVDDYKLFGKNSTENAKRIMNDCNIDKNIQDEVCSAINTIGYNKRIKGIIPPSIESKIVSDADMCDTLGANGLLRIYTYGLNNNRPFFVRDIFPIKDLESDNYTQRVGDSSIGHIFEKILKLKDLMLTESGKEEAKARHQIIVDFLHQFFKEENAPEWKEYLDNYLKEHK